MNSDRGHRGVEAWMRGPISRLISLLSTPGIARRCPGERVGSGGGLPGGRLVRAAGVAPCGVPTPY